MKIYKRVMLIVALMLIFGLFVTEAEAKKYVMRWSYAVPAGSSLATIPEKAAELIKKDPITRDTIVVKLYPARQLYKSKDALQAVMRGDIQAVHLGSWYLEALCPELSVLDVPFLFKTLDACQRAMDGEVGKLVYAPLEKFGITMLGNTAFGAYSILSTKHQVVWPKDIKNMKIRSLGLASLIWKEVGAAPISLPASDIYMGLRRGVIDGADISIISVVERRLYEVAKYYNYSTVHALMIGTVVNSKWLNDLPEKVRTRLTEIVKIAQAEHVRLTKENVKKYRKIAQEKGVKIHVMSTKEREKWVEATKNVLKLIEDKQKVNLLPIIEKVQKYNN